jgi:hypothetical protein
MLAMLTLPVQKEPDLGPCAQRILALRPDLIELIVPILSERFQGLSPSQIMATLGISKDFWRQTRAFQDILAEGRQEGVQLGLREGRKLGQEEGRRQAGALALRQLERRCGALDAPTSSRIESLSACRNWKIWPWPCLISAAPRIYRPGWSRWNPERKRRAGEYRPRVAPPGPMGTIKTAQRCLRPLICRVSSPGRGDAGELKELH